MIISDREWALLSKRLDLSRATVSKSAAECIDELERKQKQAKAGVNINAMQQRSKDDPFKSDREREYAAVLDAEQAAGLIKRWSYEPMGLRIDDGNGKSCVFWPDFGVWNSVWILEFREVKGKSKHALKPAARVKFLAARRLFPEHNFRMIQRTDSGWEEIL